MTNNLLTQEKILRRLAEQLDDKTLQLLFPGQQCEQIRQMIVSAEVPGKGTAGLFAPAPVLASLSLPPAKTLARLSPVRSSPVGPCRLFTDGASRGNPGQAGAGAVLLSEDGEELASCSLYLGTCTNNVAEYKALILGLDKALQLGCQELTIALDSELIVRQIQGRYKVKNEGLLPLFQQVQERLGQINKWSILHVPRAQNARADQLANQGIDQKDG